MLFNPEYLLIASKYILLSCKYGICNQTPPGPPPLRLFSMILYSKDIILCPTKVTHSSK